MFDLGRTFLQSVERSPDTIALVDGNERLNFARWALRIGAVQQGLADLGLRCGDHLLAILQNRWEMATLYWACQFAGIVITPLNWRAKTDEIDYCLHDCTARAVVFESVAEEALEQSRLAALIPRIGTSQAQAATGNFTSWISSTRDPIPHAEAADLSVMLYTSGTTGRPKGVPRRHRAERMSALAHVAQNRYGRNERALGVMSLYHTMGVHTLIAQALIDGCYVCLPRFDAKNALAAIQRERITHLYLVPTLYHDLLAHPDFSTTDVSSVRKLGFAGAPMHESLLQQLKTAFQPELFVNHYGSSEIFTFAFNPDAAAKPGCVGRAGLNSRLRVIKLGSIDPAAHAASSEEGEIIADLSSDEAFDGYHNRPDADQKCLHDGWYFSGDTGYFDATGDLFVTGRIDDMIISGGENISPAGVESILSLHPAVDEVAVAGLHDERWGQKVVAFVKARMPVAPAELDTHCQASELDNFKRPREYVFVREIPKSPVGKVLRRKLMAGEYERA